MPNKWFLTQAEKQTTQIMRHGLEDFAELVKKEVDKGAPGSIKGKTEVIFGLRRIKIVNSHRAAAFVEFGTPAHVITPKTAKVLRWIDKATGRAIFAKRVRHPGTDPNPFMRRGISKAVKKVKRAFR